MVCSGPCRRSRPRPPGKPSPRTRPRSPRRRCASCSPRTRSGSRGCRARRAACSSTTRRTASPTRRCSCSSRSRSRPTSTSWRDKMFAGEKINVTEDRAVLHVALRNRVEPADPRRRQGRDARGQRRAREDARVHRARAQRRRGRATPARRSPTSSTSASAARDLGPVMVDRGAASPTGKRGLRAHFVSNVDGTHIAETLKHARPRDARCSSSRRKTFTTQETMTNAQTARDVAPRDSSKDDERGRRSTSSRCRPTRRRSRSSASTPRTCSSSGTGSAAATRCGAPSACRSRCVIGMDNFEELLAGGHAMDEHFRTAPLEKNLPVDPRHARRLVQRTSSAPQTHAILPYDQYMHRFAAYFQQGDMESQRQERRPRRATASPTTRPGPIDLGRARHERPARVLPADPPGHAAHPVRLHRAGRDAQPARQAPRRSCSRTSSRRPRR